MAWRGRTSITDRLWAALPYVLPIAGSLIYAGAFVQLLPVTAVVIAPLALVGFTYLRIVGVLGPWGEWLIFLGLFLFVVRQPKVPHFIRYNTMQALMISIILALTGAVLEIFNLSRRSLISISSGLTIPQLIAAPFQLATLCLFAAIFLCAAAAYCYSLYNVAQGKYAEIKWISDAAYHQTQV